MKRSGILFIYTTVMVGLLYLPGCWSDPVDLTKEYMASSTIMLCDVDPSTLDWTVLDVLKRTEKTPRRVEVGATIKASETNAKAPPANGMSVLVFMGGDWPATGQYEPRDELYVMNGYILKYRLKLDEYKRYCAQMRQLSSVRN